MIRPGFTSHEPRRGSRMRAAIVLALTATLALGPTVAEAQSQGDGPTRGSSGRHRGGGGSGVGTGVAGALIGLGVGLLIENARARADDADYEREVRPRRRVVEDEPVERPRKRPREEKPRLVRVDPAEPRAVRPKKTAKPEKTAKPAQAAKRPPSGKPPSGAAPALAAPVAIPALVQTAERAIVPNEVLFEGRPGATDAQIAALATRQGLRRISAETFALTGSTIYRYRIVNGRSVDDVAAALAADPLVASAQPNHIFTLSQTATSGFAATQYAVAKMRLNEAHASATGDKVAIAVIDSGVDARHPSLKGSVAESFDPVGGAFKPHVHGTAIASLAAGRGDLASPAPAARIYAVRAFAPDQPAKPGQQGTTMHIIRGIDWAASRNARIVNMSFAGPRDAKIAEFIAAGVKRGAIYVAAAGNAGPSSPPLYPAADPNVIAVTATDADDRLLGVANRGEHLALAAPGVEVLVAAPGGRYAYMSGTSMSSAGIAGVLALMLQARPDLTPADARAALTSSSRDLGAPGADPEFGAGGADARGALDALAPPATVSVEPAPAVTPVSDAPVSATPVSASANAEVRP